MSCLFLRAVVALLLLVLLTSACGGPAYRTRVLDSPATGNLKGHQKPYTVNGQRYDPLLSHDGFVEDGVASWYGKDFHGKKTSNGEIYDMYAMTAAHKTLPLGVFVRVRNRNNGKETVVRVNDRGPFVKGRIIDLSYAAAKELDVVGPGTAPVHIEALGYRDRDRSGAVSYHAPASYDEGSFGVQIGAFTVADNARRLVGDMKKRFGSAGVQTGTVNGTLFHRVRVGNYRSLAAAEVARDELEKNGYPSCFVVALD